MLGGRALGDAPQDLENDAARIARFLEQGARPEIEDGAALAAAIIDQRGAMAIMRRLGGRQEMALRTVQPVGLEMVEQPLIASVFIEHIR
jgi:hypothetical protein